jgi:hypothetical protein
MLDGIKLAQNLRITATVHVEKQVKRQKVGIAKR